MACALATFTLLVVRELRNRKPSQETYKSAKCQLTYVALIISLLESFSSFDNSIIFAARYPYGGVIGYFVIGIAVSIMESVPDTYKAKLLTSADFQSLFYSTMLHMSAVDRKEPDAKLENKSENNKKTITPRLYNAPYSIQVAATMLDYSLQAIIGSMPEEFKRSLKQQIFPFLTLVNAITNFQSSQQGNRSQYYTSFELDPDFPHSLTK